MWSGPATFPHRSRHRVRARIIDFDRSTSGHTLVEFAAALSLASIAAATVVSGVSALRDAVSLLTARQQLAGVLEFARREAYRRGTTVEARPGLDGRSLRVSIAGIPPRNFELERSRIVATPARGYVRFFASGMADNATFTIATGDGSQANVVVNQRGEIRWRQ